MEAEDAVAAAPQPSRRPRRARRLIVWLIAVLIVIGALAACALIPARDAAAAWEARRVGDAIEKASWWSQFRLWPNQYHQVLAAAYLSVGNRAAADPHLAAMRGKRLLVCLIDKNEVARQLFGRGRYRDFLAYDAAVQPLFGDDAQVYRAAALVTTNQISEAEATLHGANDPKVAVLQQAINARKQGSYPLILDRSGQPIALYQIVNKDVVALNSDFGPLVEGGPQAIEPHIAAIGVNDVIETSLDPAMQKAAIAALGGFRGGLVAIDPRDNTILAAASSGGGNVALEEQYEPGSVIKVLTALNAITNNVSVNFPYQCNGAMDIDGRRFGDWLASGHGVLPDLEEAMAESCNIVFADLGLRLGIDRLRTFMNSAGFDRQAYIGLYHVPLGRTVGPMLNRYETAFYAIGLEHETATVLHLAMLASMMANRGVITPPVLVRARRSILGDATKVSPPVGERIVAPEVAERVISTMVAAATREKATGRHAAPEGVSLALKTGTAGSKKGGLSSVIVAFAPVDKPKIAFALVAEDAGPAEYAGAKIAHDFLEAIRGSL